MSIQIYRKGKMILVEPRSLRTHLARGWFLTEEESKEVPKKEEPKKEIPKKEEPKKEEPKKSFAGLGSSKKKSTKE